MAETEWTIRGCRQLKRAVFIFCRYPAFTAKYLRDHIELFGAEPRELEDYRENLVTNKRVRALLLVSIYFAYTIKNIYVLYAWMDSFDYENYQENFKPLGYEPQQLLEMNYSLPAETLKHISCLYTNCTRLGPTEANESPDDSLALLTDVSRLPMLALCYPMLERLYYTPATKLGTFGILCFVITMYTHMLLGSWTTIQQMLLPATNDLMMSVTSPKVSRKLMRVRTRELLSDLALSLRNYRLLASWGTTNTGGPLQPMRASSDQQEPLSFMSADSPKLRDLKHPSDWALTHLGSLRGDCALRAKLDRLEAAPVKDKSRQELLVDSTLRELYFKGQSEREIERAIDNCMPAVYTEWWRRRLASILVFITLQMFAICTIIGLGLFAYVSRRISIEAATVQQFARHMATGNCSVWLERAKSFAPDQTLSLDRLEYSWNAFSVLDAITLNVCGVITLMLMYGQYWSMIMHISVWLAEIRMFIVASLLASRFQHERDRQEAERGLGELDGKTRETDRLASCIERQHLVSTRDFYNIPNLRQQLKQSILLFPPYAFKKIQRRDKSTHNTSAYMGEQAAKPEVFDYHLLNSKHSDRNYADRFLAEILFLLPTNLSLSEQSVGLLDKIHYDIETMEQIYVNFRLLIGYVRGLNSAMRVLITNAYLLNYGYILVSIICRRKFNNLNSETIFLSVVAFVVTNYLIFLSADFHANAKQMQQLLWSLIAQLTYSKNLRVQHIRSLWIKQTVDLDNNGGLALSAYGVPITYVFIIQLIIWTATIFVLALKPHGQEG